MEKLGVVKDVIDKAPEATLEVLYSDDTKVDNGNVLTPTAVKNPPKVKWNGDAASFYLLVMIDPDAPSRKDPRFREWQHWAVGNIVGADISKGEVLAEYIGAGPPKGTDLHRYVILVYKQPGKLSFDEEKLSNTSSRNRGKFSTRKFAQKYKLGDPIAGNFFQAQYDEYVPKLMRQLQGT